MNDYEKRMREYERAKKRQEREELRIAREIGRRRKEQDKMEERDRAELEVGEFQAQLNVVLSLHREVGPQWDWRSIVSSLPPYPPTPMNRREMRLIQDLAIADPAQLKHSEDLLEEAKDGDRLESEAAHKVFEEEKAEWGRMRSLGRRILAGDLVAFREAMIEFSPLSEMQHLGSRIEFTMHSPSFVECVLTMKDASAIPSEVKSMTATGKLTARAMPRQQFHEIYQDYICGGILRVAREVFALLPVDDLLVTVIVPVEEITGLTSEQPVLSVVITRSAVQEMNFERLDPSDTIEELVFRGDFKATRKAGAFQPIIPIKYEEMVLPSHQDAGVERLIQRVTNLRTELKEQLAKLQETSIS